ncbi:MAG: hypothetical protein ACKPKO_31820, partial [Candidatus Fonsibacter sp.]
THLRRLSTTRGMYGPSRHVGLIGTLNQSRAPLANGIGSQDIRIIGVSRSSKHGANGTKRMGLPALLSTCAKACAA